MINSFWKGTNLFLSLNYLKVENNSNEWLDVVGTLPGALTIFDVSGKSIKSKNNNILSIYNNKHICDPGEIIQKVPRIMPARLNFNETNLIKTREINLNEWYDLNPTNEYELIFKPMLYIIFPSGYEAVLVKFDNINIRILSMKNR